MSSLNVVVLVGNLTVDPELEYAKSGTARCNFSIAVNEYRGDEQDVTFVPIVCWGNTAENAAEYLSKGSPVAIQGRLSIDNYEDKDGNNRKYTQVVANRVQFLSGGNGNTQNQQKSDQSKGSNSNDKDDPPFDT